MLRHRPLLLARILLGYCETRIRGGRDGPHRRHRAHFPGSCSALSVRDCTASGVCDMKRTVEIAGGGIAGLALAQKGWRVRVHERDSALPTVCAGVYVWENGLRVLDALGVLNEMIDGVIPATRHETRNHNGAIFASSKIGRDVRLFV